MARKKKTIKRRFSKAQLGILYECWKDADNYKDRTVLIEARLPKVPILAALKKMRSLAKSDPKWLRWATRKKNEKERERLAKKKEREKKKEDVLKRRVAREERKKRTEKEKAEKGLREKIRSRLLVMHYDRVKEEIDPYFFFCGGTHQYVHNISCIFRIFSEQHEFFPGGPCDKCSRMDKYIPILTEVIKNGRQNRSKPNQTGKRGRKVKVKGSKTRKAKARKAKGNE
jgi:hypothetical protein